MIDNRFIIGINSICNEYTIARVCERRVATSIIGYEELKRYVKDELISNYKLSCDGTCEYTQGCDTRLELGEKGDRFLIITRIVKGTETLGFDILASRIANDSILDTKLMRLTYADTLRLMKKTHCVNAKYSDTNNVISCLAGNFDTEVVQDIGRKIKKEFLNTVVKETADKLEYTDKELTRSRHKQYAELYSNYMLGDESRILEEYAESKTMDIIKDKLENGRYKKHIKKALVYGLVLATIGGVVGNATGFVDVMSKNHIKIDKKAESPTTKAEAIAMIEMADTLKVDYTLGWSSGTVYADGVKVAKLESKLIGILDSVKLTTLSGDEIASSKQHVNWLRDFTVTDSNGEVTKLNGKLSLKGAKLVQTDADDNIIGQTTNSFTTLYTLGNIKNADGDTIYSITKEPLGKTFTVEKVAKSEVSNTDALVLGGLLGISTPRSNSSKSK